MQHLVLRLCLSEFLLHLGLGCLSFGLRGPRRLRARRARGVCGGNLELGNLCLELARLLFVLCVVRNSWTKGKRRGESHYLT